MSSFVMTFIAIICIIGIWAIYAFVVEKKEIKKEIDPKSYRPNRYNIDGRNL